MKLRTLLALVLPAAVISCNEPNDADGSGDATATGSSTDSLGPGPTSSGDASSGPDATTTVGSGVDDTSTTAGVDPSGASTSTSAGENTGSSDGTDTGLVRGPCGDGVLNIGEACDDGNFDNTDLCTEYCLEPSCGDGYVQPSNSETCDDGNGNDGDGCNVDCVQSGASVWTVTFNGSDDLDDVGRAVAVDGSGAVVVAGSTTVVGESSNVFLWKVAATDAAEIWSRDVDGPGSDTAYDVAINAQDEIVATGSFHVPAQPNPGGKIWTAGFAPLGNELWSETTETNGSGRAITVGADDSVYATGDIAGTAGPELWLEKRSANGSSLWIAQDVYGSDSSCDLDYHQNPEGLATDGEHVFVVWRSTCPGGSFPNSPKSKVSRFRAIDGGLTYNPDGCCQHWRIDVFTPGVFVGTPARAFDMARAPDDSLLIAGEANGGGYLWGYGPDLESGQLYNAADWEGTPGGPRFSDVAVDGEGNVILAADGGRVVKSNAAGQLLWEHVEPSVTTRGVAVDDADFVYAVGSLEVPGQASDVWLRKIAP